MTLQTSVGANAEDFVADAGLARPKTSARADIRIPALDGLRGLMTLFVILSHFYGEAPHGVGYACVGWTAVLVFFVLSGYLVGRLIATPDGWIPTRNFQSGPI